MHSKLRTTFYSLILVAGIFETGIAVFTALDLTGFDGFTRVISVFAWIAVLWALATWIWTSVLPLSSHKLTRAITHFKSLIVFSAGWFVFTIMFVAQFPLTCTKEFSSDDEASWCVVAALSSGFAFLLFAFCVVSASVIYRVATRSQDGWLSNVARNPNESYLTIT